MHNPPLIGPTGVCLNKENTIAFPPELFDRLSVLGVGLEGQKMLDLGTGSGGFARSFADRGCIVTAIDKSADMLSDARGPGSGAQGSLTFARATAENTGLPDAVFDIVVAGQAWHWFDQRRAAQESRRVLKHDGRIALAQMDWVPRKGGAAEATEEIIQRYNPDWNILFRQSDYMDWSRQLGIAGFGSIQEATFNAEIDVSPEVWRRRIRASAGVGAVLPPEMAGALDADLAGVLAADFAGDIVTISHRVFYLVAEA
jgi:SAM-dependent methyltransferase